MFEFRELEKAYMKKGDELAAMRRKLPMTEVDHSYSLAGEDGEASLDELFDGKDQLIVYHFMFASDWDEGCEGCSMMVDHFGHPAHLEARNTKLVLISSAPYEKLRAFKKRMGWSVPWYSSEKSTFNRDFGGTTKAGENHLYSVFLRRGETIYLTYQTEARGVEKLGDTWSLLDITPMGRQELWEDSPDWVKQTSTYNWWKYHDRYN
ncbi:hypothetical protein JCM19039_469 [Geomicrobium sp. JCM 19039]|nr:hypothetical protein JCM19039_469 [Geomicrobium sp. JCM 19039]